MASSDVQTVEVAFRFNLGPYEDIDDVLEILANPRDGKLAEASLTAELGGRLISDRFVRFFRDADWMVVGVNLKE